MSELVQKGLHDLSAKTKTISRPIAGADHHVDHHLGAWAGFEFRISATELPPHFSAEEVPIKNMPIMLMAKDLAEEPLP